jgi:hypothetical protein
MTPIDFLGDCVKNIHSMTVAVQVSFNNPLVGILFLFVFFFGKVAG